MEKDILIRRAAASDGKAICRINRLSLGYAYDEAKTCSQLSHIIGTQDAIFTALCDGEVTGYIHVSPYSSTFSDTLANIMALAVDEDFRRRGVGKKLISAAEKWAADSGFSGVRLESGFERKDAHRFYETCGYIHRKDHKSFLKTF